MVKYYDYDIHGDYACFYGGCFSQWYPSTIEDEINSKPFVFNCAEQAMMFRKAEFFKDDESMKLILKSQHPAEQKALGRKVKNFNADEWNSVCRDIVYRNNLLKFSQHHDLQQVLFSTENLTLVEASPYDTIWGIGRGLDYPYLSNKSKWRGTNWLGLAITQVREALKVGG